MLPTIFFQAVKSRDAILMFSFLWDSLGATAGAIDAITNEEIAERLNAAGFRTSRDSRFTVAVVRNRIAELEKTDVVKKIELGTSGAFQLLIFNPAPRISETETKEQKKEKLFFKNENENENEKEQFFFCDGTKGSLTDTRKNGTETQNEAPVFEKKTDRQEKNKYINKLINKPANFSRRTTANLRCVVDYDSSTIDLLRRKICEEIWEPDVNPDLIDRCAAAVVLGIVTKSEWASITADAKAERTQFERNPNRGKRTLWATICWRIKSAFERAGWDWTPTKIGREPRPESRRPKEIEKIVEDQTKARTDVAPRSIDELLQTTEGFTLDDFELTADELARRVASVRGITDLWEARTEALIVRSALRDLKKLTTDPV